MKKRGLSDVVTVTLIILLAVAAVVIVWAFVRSTIEEAGKDINADCLKTNLKVISCNVTGTGVVVENSAGGSLVNNVKLIYFDSAGTASETEDPAGCLNMNPLDRRTCILDLANLPAAHDKVDAAAVIGIGEQSQVCNPSGRPVNCA